VTDYTWPSEIIPASSDMAFVANTAAFVSPLTQSARTFGRGGDHWQCSLKIPPLTNTNRSILRAFLVKLRGQTNRVIVGDHSYVRRGTQSANVLVKGASQTGHSLIVDGATVSATLLSGDYFSVGTELKMLTADATANGSGEMTLAFVPALRTSPADNAAVTITAPTGRFLLSSNTSSWSNVPARISSFTVELIEDIT
jgi:hypothetical protein